MVNKTVLKPFLTKGLDVWGCTKHFNFQNLQLNNQKLLTYPTKLTI